MIVAQTLKAVILDRELSDEVYRILDGNSEDGHVKLDDDLFKKDNGSACSEAGYIYLMSSRGIEFSEVNS